MGGLFCSLSNFSYTHLPFLPAKEQLVGVRCKVFPMKKYPFNTGIHFSHTLLQTSGAVQRNSAWNVSKSSTIKAGKAKGLCG